MTILACQAGKDVYVEKPASQTIIEGERMVAAARKSGRIVQTGLQQRTSEHFQSAVEFVHRGGLGRVSLAKAWTVHRRKAIGSKKDTPTPPRVDYDAWLGPAPERAFNPNRFHYNWRWFWDYGTGELGNWGAHMLDVARWGLGVGLPSRVCAVGGNHHFQDDQETPDSLMVGYDYAGQSIVWEHRLWSAHPMEGRSAAVAFYGQNGTLIVDRGGWKVYGQSEPVVSPNDSDANRHLRHFIDCVKSRRQPRASLEVGHLSSVLCHLGNIAYRLRRDVSFDPLSMNFGRDDAANALLGREYRRKWELPAV
jgi:predicted dehydrogenase